MGPRSGFDNSENRWMHLSRFAWRRNGRTLHRFGTNRFAGRFARHAVERRLRVLQWQPNPRFIAQLLLENGARTQKLRVYQMTENPAARAMLGYLFVRGGVHAMAYAKACKPSQAWR
jgi:hypothetical protein